jgi:prophage maintenance system killer protein
MDELKNNIFIYQTENGETKIDVKMQNDTVWLTQDSIVKLFESSKANISEHISHIYEEGELEKGSTVRKFRTVRKEGSRNVSRDLEYYNLDLILSVGYRVKSKIATKFRIWATQTLKEYLTKGYVINEQKLKAEQEKVKSLQDAISLLSRSLENQVETLKEAKDVARVLSNFAHGLDLLDNFDHKTLDKTGKTKKEVVIISEKEYLEVVNKMKSEFASDVFANPKDSSFSSSVNQIYQTFDGIELYPTLEEKAAMLLYLITKNHSFSDGNKRIAASCFLYFMDRNGMLYKNETPIIDSSTLFALTILIAESDPKEMETIKNVVVSVLNGEGK